MQAHGAFAGVEQRDVGRLRGFLVEGVVGQIHQGLPALTAAQRKRQLGVLALAQQTLGGWVGHADHVAFVHHQHAIAQVLNHQGTHLGLHLGCDLVALGNLLFAHQPCGELVHQIGQHKIPGARQRTLQVALGVVTQ